MKEQPKSSLEYLDPGAQLNAAIEILESFTKKNISEPIPHVFHQHDQSGSSFKKILKLSRCLLSEKTRQKHSIEKLEEEKKVRKALHEVQRFHQLVDEKLANRALEAIENYHRIFETSEFGKISWKKKLLKFLINKNNLSLKQSYSFTLKTKDYKPLSSYISTIDPISKREEDAFRMKVISMIQNHGILFPSVAEAFQAVRNTPIHSQLAASVITLEQKFSPFPGETIILKGAFRRNPETPIPESFQLLSESFQTGFPYPIQHTGWALSDALIYHSPLRSDELTLLPQILVEKGIVAEELSKQGPLQAKAKEVFLKKEKPDSEQHRKLFFSIIEAANQPEIPYSETFISNCESFNKRCIDPTLETLKSAWINRSNPNLLSTDPNTKLQAALDILDIIHVDDPFEKIISDASKNIILQYFSEIIGYETPKLTLFEKKLQACAFKQLREFMNELRTGIPNDSTKQLEEEIALFQSETVNDPIVQELEVYFDGCLRT